MRAPGTGPRVQSACPRGLLACLLVLSACARPGAVVAEPAGAPAADQLRVVSCNVHFGLAGKLRDAEDERDHDRGRHRASRDVKPRLFASEPTHGSARLRREAEPEPLEFGDPRANAREYPLLFRS